MNYPGVQALGVLQVSKKCHMFKYGYVQCHLSIIGKHMSSCNNYGMTYVSVWHPGKTFFFFLAHSQYLYNPIKLQPKTETYQSVAWGRKVTTAPPSGRPLQSGLFQIVIKLSI